MSSASRTRPRWCSVNSSVTERADSAALGVAFGPPWSTGVPGLRMTSVESVSTLKGRAGARRRCEAGQETCGRLDRPAFNQVQIIVTRRAPAERQPARGRCPRPDRPLARPGVRPTPHRRNDPRSCRRPGPRHHSPHRRRRRSRTTHRRMRPQTRPVPRRTRRRRESGHGCRLDRRDRSRESQLPAQHQPRGAASPHDRSRDQGNRGQDLRLTYHPGRRLVEASVAPLGHGFFDGVRGGT